MTVAITIIVVMIIGGIIFHAAMDVIEAIPENKFIAEIEDNEWL